MPQQRIVPNLWFDTQALEAAEFYCSVFPNSRIRSVARYPEGAPGPTGEVMTVEYELDGQRVVHINGGPHRAMQAMLKMRKLDVAALRRAADAVPAGA